MPQPITLMLVAVATVAAAPPPIVLDGTEPPAGEAKPARAAYDPVVPLAPSTPWSSYDEGYRCTVERTFGAKPGVVALKLARSALPRGVDGHLLMVRANFSYRYSHELTIDFNDGQPPLAARANVYAMPKAGITLFSFGVDAYPFWTAWGRARAITFRYGKDVVATLTLTGAADVAKLAGDCARRQMLALGGAPAEAAAWLGETPSLSDQGWKWVQGGRAQNLFFSDDYPAAALAKKIGGRTLIAYRVGADGHPVECRTVKSSRNRELDDTSCAILSRRVTFTPARDPAGRPASVIDTTWISWVAPSAADYLDSGFVGSFIGAGQGGGVAN